MADRARPDAVAAALLREDAAARSLALDVRASLLVQAPAGSGKTELLIQRCLALLGSVDEPERIVALTFTRKAAGEMRERVRAALIGARNGTPVSEPHERTTRALAEAALAQDARRGWRLTEHPARLSMQTFDALATALARRAPVAAGLGPAPAYADDARPLYRLAAESAIASASADDPHWRRLLAHLDNDAGQVTELLAALLGRRDQVLRHVGGAEPAALRAELEAALAAEVRAVLASLQRALPQDLAPGLATLAAYAATNLADTGADDPARAELASALRTLAQRGGLPGDALADAPNWAALAQWLLTKDGTTRRTVTANAGFPAASGVKGAEAKVRGERKEAMLALLARIDAVPGLAGSLDAARRLPQAARIGDAAWAVVEALLHVLRQAAAQLTLVFAREHAVDFVQGNLAALEALGPPEAPTDLLLRVDARVQHLLIDEFQDTSITQMDLLARLTAGWSPGDGRTLFAVGDPMQSIYRFREAEVRLFVAAQSVRAIAGLPVECVRLRRNFRSQANIVAWVNATFPRVLGAVDDPARGAVRYAEATAARPAAGTVTPTVDIVATAAEEAGCVVRRIHAALAAGSTEIAVLVRARSHLRELLPALRRAEIRFAAVELDALSQRQAVLDLAALTHALLQPADRLSWLALLRAPWCGLALPDLFAVTAAVDAKASGAWTEVLAAPERVAELSADGRARLRRVAAALLPTLAERGVRGVAGRVRGAWLALGGPACLADALDLETAERFLEVLGAHEAGGTVPDWSAFTAALGALYAAPAPTPDTCVQVMTVHKAKGLQFDTVILPGLARTTRGTTGELLRWRRRDAGLLIAPSRARGGDDDPVYVYLGNLQREEAEAELARLLYVACTRAVNRLHLVAAPGVREDRDGAALWREPPAQSALARLWPALGVPPPPALPPPESAPPAVAALLLERLPPSFHPEMPVDALPAPLPAAAAGSDLIAFDWAEEAARQVGILAHRVLAAIARDGPDAWPDGRVEAAAQRLAAELEAAGLTAEEIPEALARVQAVVLRTLADPRGRWLLDATHTEARSEWRLGGLEDEKIVHVVLDRSFVSGGVRWIVDFKTGAHAGGDPVGFLDNEVARYRPQLERYARLVRGLDPHPIRLALYYPLVEGGFRAWDYAG